MNHRTQEWVRSHPMVAFSLLGIVLCFGTLFPVLFVIPQEAMLGQILTFYLARIGTYSPALAGMLIAGVVQPGRPRAPFARRLGIFLPVWLVSVIILSASLRLTAPASVPLAGLVILSLPAGLLPALVISSAVWGNQGVRDMLGSLVRPKGSLVYYLAALLTFPLIHVVGTVVTNILDGRALLPPLTQLGGLASTMLITFLSVLLFSGGINEESGWRGFAQRGLQAKYSPLVANLMLWFLMVIWHIPNDLVQYREGGYVLVRLGLYPFITILFGWIYNRTKGSILAPAIFHASMNSLNPLMGVFPITTAGNILLVGLALVAIVSDRMWRRLPTDHAAAHQEVALAGVTAASPV